MTTNADIRRAFNAAGRSIIAHIMGVDVLHASIVPEVGVSYDPRTTDRQQLLILAGGRAGEVVGLGYADDTDDQTTDHMREIALRLVDGDAVKRDELLLGKQHEARRLLARYRPSLMILAEALVEQHTIDWPRPGNIIDAAQRSRRRRQGRRRRRRSSGWGAAQRSTSIAFCKVLPKDKDRVPIVQASDDSSFSAKGPSHRPPTAAREHSDTAPYLDLNRYRTRNFIAQLYCATLDWNAPKMKNFIGLHPFFAAERFLETERHACT